MFNRDAVGGMLGSEQTLAAAKLLKHLRQPFVEVKFRPEFFEFFIGWPIHPELIEQDLHIGELVVVAIVAQFYLLDDVIGCTPRLHFKTSTRFIDRLMMRAIHFFEAMTRPAIRSQRLDIMGLLLRQVMAGDVEMKRTAECDIERLQSFA